LSHQVHVFPRHTITKMKNYYADDLQKPPHGAIFQAKTGKAVITAYQSGKVLFQGSAPLEEAIKWTDQAKSKDASGTKHLSNNPYQPPEQLFNRSHIGSDEAGTGDYFGPITVAACYVPKEKIALLKEIGVKDSKNLTDESMKDLSKKIVQIGIPYSLLVLDNTKYNTLQQKGWTQGTMKTILHHQSIVNVINKLEEEQPDGILIDQFCEPKVYERHLASQNYSMLPKTYFMTKAESSSISVAAASILARTRFVKGMESISKSVGMEIPKGASAKVDQAAARLIKRYGEKSLASIAKIHFANTNKAKKLL